MLKNWKKNIRKKIARREAPRKNLKNPPLREDFCFAILNLSMLKDILRDEIEKAVKKLFPHKSFSDLDISQGGVHADYTSNVALSIYRDAAIALDSHVPGGEKPGFNWISTWGSYKNPCEVSLRIKDELLQSPKIKNHFSKIDVVEPGFINFWLKDEVFIKNIGEILAKGDEYGSNKNLKNKKIIIEFTDPNPFKEFHIGHLMSNAIGESISRLYEAQNAEVKRACYQGDVGLHVAKTILAMSELPENSLPQDSAPFQEKVMFLGSAYAVGNDSYESGGNWKQKVNDLNKKIYERNNPIINQLYDWGRKISLEYFEKIYDRLGMKSQKNGKHFDFYFFESETGKRGKEKVEEYLKKGIFTESDGAIIFPEEKSGLHTRVFISSEGLPTYEAKELGLAEIKYGKYKYDTSIIITGNEINEYFKVLLKAIEFIFPEIAKKTKHLSHGMLRLPTGKMSSRTGDVITAMGLLADIEKRILEKIADRDLSEEEKSEIAGKVSLAAVKYSILKQSIGKDIIFDFDKSISFEGDSGPYIQYAYVRTQAILRKADEEKIAELKDINKVKNIGISDVERLMQKFPEVVEMAAEKFAPNYICSYLVELCRVFNSYYEKNKIVSDNDIGKYRISLTRVVGIILKNGLNLLGIPVPEKM